MIYTIKKDMMLTFAGYVIETTTDHGRHFKEIPDFWDKIMNDGRFHQLLPYADELGVCGVCYGYNPQSNTFKYMIGVNHSKEVAVSLESIAFPKMTYAAFEAKGKLPNSIQQTISLIYDFIKNSDFSYGDGPEIEVYPEGNMDCDDYVCYYWVPIKVE